MTHRRLDRSLDGLAPIVAASAAALALGLFFVFVWAPHPWGHEGFDHYHQLALALASGLPFPTMEVPWGYAYTAAAFYRVFGDHPAILLTTQVLLNAAVPWLVYRFALTWTDRRTAALAAIITGLFSFNTIYASTQSSDAVCTVIAMAAFTVFAITRKDDSVIGYAVTGILTGLAPQFRPNLILIPLLLAAYAVFERRSRHRLLQAAVLLIAAGAMLTPWVVRNYRLTGTVLPTSVHGGVQLWYGTLQSGPYLKSRVYNPRNVFEGAVFDYTSLDAVPVLIAAQAKACADAPPTAASIVFWTDRDPARHTEPARRLEGGHAEFELPPPGPAAVIYYYFEAVWPIDGAQVRVQTPGNGSSAPLVYFVSQDHLGDLDVHGDLLDIFDLVRIARHVAWQEPLAFEPQLTNARIAVNDVEPAARLLADRAAGPAGARPVVFTHDDRTARLLFSDGSSIVIPRAWSGRISDVEFTGALALAMMHASVRLAGAQTADLSRVSHAVACAQFEDVSVNDVFYRREPHQMRRYSALAFDNIRRDPVGFLEGAAYRALRVFIIEGSDDLSTVQQFSRSGIIYTIATLTTGAYFLLFVFGVWSAWRKGDAILLPLILVAYVPLTIAPVLTNMRYSVTVQPLVFIFVAAGLTTLLERAGWLSASPGARDRAESRTARQP
jgi:hypothetical protein